jgi:hypothetical protein
MQLDGVLLEMLTDRDVAFALQAVRPGSAGPREEVLRSIREAPEILTALLDDPRLYAAVSAVGDAPFVAVSPFLFFSVLLRQARRELGRRTFTAEWLAPRRRVPVFDARAIAAVLEDEPLVRYLAELLASFTHVYRREPAGDPPGGGRGPAGAASGGFDELDLDDLHALLAATAGAERFAVERRVADVALFLAGVFPDSARGAPELDRWEEESQSHYREAARSPAARRCGLAAVLGVLADELSSVRRALNFLSDRYLHPLDAEWFAAPA